MLADPGPPELDGRRGRLPYLQSQQEKASTKLSTEPPKEWYTHTRQGIRVVPCMLSVGSLTPQPRGRGEGDQVSLLLRPNSDAGPVRCKYTVVPPIVSIAHVGPGYW